MTFMSMELVTMVLFPQDKTPHASVHLCCQLPCKNVLQGGHSLLLRPVKRKAGCEAGGSMKSSGSLVIHSKIRCTENR